MTHPAAGLSHRRFGGPGDDERRPAVADIQSVIDGYKQTGLPAELVEVAKRASSRRRRPTRTRSRGSHPVEPGTRRRAPHAGRRNRRARAVTRRRREPRPAHVLRPRPRDGGDRDAERGRRFGVRRPRGRKQRASRPRSTRDLPAFARNVLANLHVRRRDRAPRPDRPCPTGSARHGPDADHRHGRAPRRNLAETRRRGAGRVKKASTSSSTASSSTAPRPTTGWHIRPNSTRSQPTSPPAFAFSLDVLGEGLRPRRAAAGRRRTAPRAARKRRSRREAADDRTAHGRAASPDSRAQRALAAALYPAGDPARRFATPQTVGSVTLDDVKAYFSTTSAPTSTTIVVGRRRDAEQARAAVARWFGGWTRRRARRPTSSRRPSRNEPHAKVVIPATGRVQAEVTLAETVPLTYDEPRLSAAAAREHRAHRRFLRFDPVSRRARSPRLRVHDRTQSVSAWHNRHTFRVQLRRVSAERRRAQALIVADLTEMQRTPLAADRLIRAKALVLGELPVAERVVRRRRQRAADLRGDRPPAGHRPPTRRGVRGDRQSVRAAMAKWVRPHDFARVKHVPAGP